MDKKKDLKYSQIAAGIAFIMLIAFCFWVFWSAEPAFAGVGGQAEVINQFKTGISGTDSTDWIDLEQYGYPSKIVFQLDIVMTTVTDSTAADSALIVSIQTSNHDTEAERRSNYWTAGYFSRDRNYGAGENYFLHTAVGSTYTLTVPRDGSQVNSTDTSYYVTPIYQLGKWYRLYFEAGATKTWSVEYPTTYIE